MPDRTPERYADIVIYEDDAKHKPYIVVECKKDGISDAEFEQATKQAIANALFSTPRLLTALRAILAALWKPPCGMTRAGEGNDYRHSDFRWQG